MTTWESLDPEVQRRCLELAEGAIGRPVTWDEVDPAWQQDWLQSVQAELCADRWEDESPGEQRRLLAILENATNAQARDELQSIISELEVDCTPENPDWEALFYAQAVQIRASSPTFAWANFATSRGAPRICQRLCSRARKGLT